MINKYDEEIQTIKNFYLSHSMFKQVTVSTSAVEINELNSTIYIQIYELSSKHPLGINVFVQVDIEEKMIQKLQSRNYNWYDFTSEELEFFDRLGYTIVQKQSTSTDQYIEDWFRQN